MQKKSNPSITAFVNFFVTKNLFQNDHMQPKSYQGTCFGHAFSMAYQYAMIDEKVCKDFTYVYIKNAQGDL